MAEVLGVVVAVMLGSVLIEHLLLNRSSRRDREAPAER